MLEIHSRAFLACSAATRFFAQGRTSKSPTEFHQQQSMKRDTDSMREIRNLKSSRRTFRFFEELRGTSAVFAAEENALPAGGNSRKILRKTEEEESLPPRHREEFPGRQSRAKGRRLPVRSGSISKWTRSRYRKKLPRVSVVDTKLFSRVIRQIACLIT